MANEVQVRLTGDSKDLQEELNRSQDSIGNWAKGIKVAVGALAALFVVDKIVGWGKAMVDGADEEARAFLKLETVLENTGGAAGFTMEQFAELASQAQRFHGVADDVYISTAAVLSAFDNLRGENIDRTIIAAADLAEVMGGDVASQAEMLGKALNNPVKGMMMLRRQGVLFTEEQQAMIEKMVESGDVVGAQNMLLDELSSKFGGAASKATQTFGGRIEQLHMAIGDMGEAIGGYMIPMLEAVLPPIEAGIHALGNLVGALTESEGDTRQWADSWGAYFVDVLKYSVGVVTDTFSLFEFIWKNFTKIGEREGLNWTLSVVSFVENVKHLFTETAPAYISWFFDNWASMLYDYANFQATVYSNMWKNVVGFFEGVWNWLKGDEANFEWTALTDGFEATTKELPEIAERNLSDFEKMLKKDIAAIDEDLGKSWNDIFDKNKKFADSLFEDKEPIDLTPKVSDKPFKIVGDETDKAKKGIDKVKDDLKSVDSEIKIETKLGDNAGLEDLNKLITDGNKEATKAAQEFADKQMEVAGKPFVFMGDNKKAVDKAVAPDDTKKTEQAAQVRGTKTKTIDDLIRLLEVQHPETIYAITNASGGLA